MKTLNFASIVTIVLLVGACGCAVKSNNSNTQVNTIRQDVPTDEVAIEDIQRVFVYYFYGAKRCKTCTAVEKVVRQTIKENFPDETAVKFAAIATDDKANNELVERYEVAWNKLIIVKGGDVDDITKFAFANAVSNPTLLQGQLLEMINKKIEE